MKDKEDAVPVWFIKLYADTCECDRDAMEFLLSLWETHKLVYGPQEEKPQEEKHGDIC